ncbi:MAG: hypothetical protein QOJ39_845 [Candidatus Eremiobacteraeota bacterium]|nr:hypothetical protein [Candidatus Eremiobacteraeota bacterium]
MLGTGGLSALFYKDHGTVEVNGEKHFGELIDSDD